MSTCACGAPVAIRKSGECSRCYQRRYHRERRAAMPRTTRARRPAAERFWEKVTPHGHGGCWIWTAARVKGYGSFDRGLAHRFAWEDRHGPIPPGLTVDHLCGVQACVNPDHLDLVPASVNTQRAHRRTGRGSHQPACVRGHELAAENVAVIRRADGTRRACLACRAEYNRRRRERITCPVCHGDFARGSMRRHESQHRAADAEARTIAAHPTDRSVGF